MMNDGDLIQRLTSSNPPTYYQLRREGALPPKSKSALTQLQVKAFAERGLLAKEIADRLGITTCAVYQHSRRLGITFQVPAVTENRILDLIAMDLTIPEISKLLDISNSRVSTIASKHGVKAKRYVSPQVSQRDQQLCEMFTSGGKTLQDIGNVFGLTRERVRQILNKYGISDRYQFTFENSGKAEQALRLYGLGATLSDITKTFGVSLQTISNLKKSRKLQKQRRVYQFWQSVGVSRDPNVCWEWKGGTGVAGYARTSWNGRPYGCHQIAFYLHNGHWAKNWTLHTCDNPPCCNPHHLYDGTPQDNVRDRDGRGRNPYRNGKAIVKLNWETVTAIRKRLADGDTQHDIAADFGVGVATINGINTGRTWSKPRSRGRNILSIEKVRDVRRALATKRETQAAIAARLDVHPNVVCRIANNKCYRGKIFYPENHQNGIDMVSNW